ncbi:hypothetical protein GTY77_18220 [Streptomyces sp. SID8380]|nr:hypothetical protein [Streptomyces sp. SID8380]
MPKFILVTDGFHGKDWFVINQNGGDSYMDDKDQAMIFESEEDARRERMDDECLAKLTFNPDGTIKSYDIV